MKLSAGIANLVLAACLAGGCAAINPQMTNEEARAAGTRAVADYADAIAQLDSEKLSRLAHPALVTRMGGIAKFREAQREFVLFFKARGWPGQGSERLGNPSAPYIDGKTVVVGVPSIRKIPGTADTAFVYVAASYDGGTTWSILMLGCTDERWLKGIAPGYRGVPDILGQDNPAYAVFEKAGTIDEEMFLKGTHWSGQ